MYVFICTLLCIYNKICEFIATIKIMKMIINQKYFLWLCVTPLSSYLFPSSL